MAGFPQDASRRLAGSGLETFWAFLRDGSVNVNEHVTLLSTGPMQAGLNQAVGALQLSMSKNPPCCRVHTVHLAGLLHIDFYIDAVTASHGELAVHLRGIGDVSFKL